MVMLSNVPTYSTLSNNPAADLIVFKKNSILQVLIWYFFTITNQINLQLTFKNVQPAGLFHPAGLFDRLEY